jgi:hypothetical protein
LEGLDRALNEFLLRDSIPIDIKARNITAFVTDADYVISNPNNGRRAAALSAHF